AEQPMIEAMEGFTTFGSLLDEGSPLVDPETLTGVVGDPHNPSFPVYVSQLDENGNLVDPSQLELTVTSVERSSGVCSGDELPGVTITTDPEDAALRTIHFEPHAACNSAIDLTLTGTTGLKTIFGIGYDVSKATTPTSTVLENSSDDSTAIDVGDGYF